MRLVKGSHIVVRRLFEGEQAYILQNVDRRIVFAIPYENEFTLIGTTDLAYEGDPAEVAISKDEIAYLCQVVNDHFVRQIAPADVVWTYAGVRPLHDDESTSASAVTRDYVLEVDDVGGEAPLLSVFGGKITTFRRLAEHALAKLTPIFPGWDPAGPIPRPCRAATSRTVISPASSAPSRNVGPGFPRRSYGDMRAPAALE